MALTTETFSKGVAGAANTLTGDQVVVEVQEILQAQGFGIYSAFARPNKQNGSLFTYKTPERMIPKAYDRTATGKLSVGGVVPQVDILANEADWINLEIEDTEFATQVMAEAEKSRLANSIVQSIYAMFDAEMLKTLLSATTEATVDMSKGTTQDALTTARLKLGQEVAKLESMVDAKTLGVDASRQMIILSPAAHWNYINSFDTNVLSQSEEIKLGKLVIRKINGALVIKHPLLGSNHAAGTLHETKAYDFSKHEGILVTDIAAAFPVVLDKVTSRINDFGNEEIIARVKYGKGLIRDKLITKLAITP